MSKNRSRRSRRDRHHEASHAGAHQAPPAIPDHPSIPGGEPILVSDQDGVDALVEHVRTTGMFAFDTEFIGEETYVPNICLLQVSTEQQLFLVDPFVFDDLEPIWSLLADPDILTLVHAGGQDLEPVERCTGQLPANVIDTQVAAGFVGCPYPLALVKTVQIMTGCPLSKEMTFTKWDDRPLSDMQKRYAADDVRYLPLTWQHIEKQLEDLGHMDWCREECRQLCLPGANSIDIATICRKFHRRNPLRKSQWMRMCHLVHFRNETARSDNLPARTLMPDGSLSDIVRRNPSSLEALYQVKGLPRSTVQRHGGGILEMLQHTEPAFELPPLPPKLPDETPELRVRIDALWAVLNCWCIANQVSPSLVSTRAEIAQWVLGNADALDPGVLWPGGWRKDFAGDFLARFLSGELALPMLWKEDRLQQAATPAHEDG